MNKRLLQISMAVALVLAIAAAIYYRDSFDVDLIEQWLNQAEGWAPFVFILIYIIATVLFLPGSVFTLAGGVIFGPVLGVFYNVIGATIGAALSFLIARYLASNWVVSACRGQIKTADQWRRKRRLAFCGIYTFSAIISL